MSLVVQPINCSLSSTVAANATHLARLLKAETYPG
jgi:hypothetical protein